MNYHKIFKTQLVFLLLMAVTLSCKSAASVISSGRPSNKLSAKQVIKQHQTKALDFKTLQAKVRIDITQDEKTQGAPFTLRMEKDKTIWLSAPLGLARLIITPEKVRFYNKRDNEYFDGDYKLLSNVAGIDLDFNKVQNILLGEAIFNLNEEPHIVAVNQNAYELQPKNQNALLELFYMVNPSHFKMNSQQLYQKLKNRILQVDYTTYQEVNKQTLPKDVKVLAVEGSKEVSITLELKSVSLNQDVRFPFKIPTGYKEMEIK